jgi:thymidylate synthase (FAD)
MRTSDIVVTLIDHMGTDLSVVNAARVSFDKESTWAYDSRVGEVLHNNDVKLIQYLAKHKHTSPFNHAFMTFRVKAPIFVARQLVKHKFMPWNEVSRRYVDSEPEFYIPDSYRASVDNVKQGSDQNKTILMVRYGNGFESPKEIIETLCQESLDAYNSLLAGGVCAEQARMVLPLNTMTEWIWSGTLGAFADMLRLRLDPHAQYESRIVAQLILKEVEKHFPVSIKALLDG